MRHQFVTSIDPTNSFNCYHNQMTFGLHTSSNTYIENNASFVFTAMTDNRKRLREDDTCEFMPLSKRINNLHINNNLSNTLSQSSDSSQSNGACENGIASPCSSLESERRPSYDPGVSSADSSYYYNNKLLFELHLERLERSGQQYQY